MLTVQTLKSEFPKAKKRTKKYKVLLVAGGGLFGYVVTNLISKLDYDLYSKIDCCAGTSIGGILTLAYAINPDYKWINKTFEEGAPYIFKKRFLGQAFGPKYDNKQLENFVNNIVGDYNLSDINKINGRDLKLIVPTLDYTYTQPRIFTNIGLEEHPELDYPLKKIGIATAAAPTYFPACAYELTDLEKDPEKLKQCGLWGKIFEISRRNMKGCPECETAMIDGGVIENIPVFTTYTTLRSRLGIVAEDIDMFIIGTGDDYPHPKVTATNMNKWNIVEWLTNFIIGYITESNELTSVNFGAQLGFNSFEYYNPLETKGSLDDVNILPRLKEQTDALADDFKEHVQAFLDR